jgi:cytochrome P450
MATQQVSDDLIYNVDLNDPDVNRDPHPFLTEMRESGRPLYNPQSGWWLATTWPHVKQVLAGEDIFGPDVELFEQLFGAIVFEAMDQPRHDEVRAIWKPHFLRAAIDAQQAAVERVVDDLLAEIIPRLRDGEVVDAFSDFVQAVPAHVVALLVGAPREDYPLFRKWNEDITGVLIASPDDTPEANALRATGAEAHAALGAYFDEAMGTRRAEDSTEDLVGVMAHSQVELTEEQRRAHLVQLIWAGSDSTAKLLSNTLVTLALHPDQRRRVADDRTLVPQTIEESLRYQTVSAALPRRVRREGTELGGVSLPAGAKIAAMTGAANRDPVRWEHPDKFDILRPPQAHVGFGTGIHSCLGVQVGRLEARVWLNRVLDEIPEYQLSVEPGEIEYGSNIMTRGPISIPIAL